jgi:predicted nucleic acid-binding protein
MRVVADTSPLHYLVLLASASVLPELFGRIIVPPAVIDELQQPRTPAEIHAWLASPPPWLEIHRVMNAPDATLAHLDAGEHEAILLAQELDADLLLMDDWEGRREAQRRGLAVAGTLGILNRAAERGLLELPDALGRLQATNFYLPAALVREMLVRDAARRGQR